MSFKQNNPISRKTSPINRDWIKGAIKRPGAFRKKAEEAGMSTKAFAEKVTSNKEDYSARTGKQAELAETLMGMSRHKSGHKNPEQGDFDYEDPNYRNTPEYKKFKRKQKRKNKKNKPKRGEAGFEQDEQEAYYESKSNKLDNKGISRMDTKKIPGQDLDKVQVDKKGEYAVNMYNRQDTIRPADGKNFKPFIKGKQAGKMSGGYLSDDDYTIKDGKISPLNKKDKRANEVRELSVNKAMKNRRTMKNRNLKPAGKVTVESAKVDLKESMKPMVEKAKPVGVPKPKSKKTSEESVETRARKSVKAPSKETASKMSISRKNCKYKK